MVEGICNQVQELTLDRNKDFSSIELEGEKKSVQIHIHPFVYWMMITVFVLWLLFSPCGRRKSHHLRVKEI